MKKIITSLVLVGILVPSLAFGASNDTVRSNIVAKLIEVISAQVNALDYIKVQTNLATNPDEFEQYLDKAQEHVNQSIQEIAVLLNPNSQVFGNVAPTTNTGNNQPMTQPTVEVKQQMIGGTLHISVTGDFDKVAVTLFNPNGDKNISGGLNSADVCKLKIGDSNNYNCLVPWMDGKSGKFFSMNNALTGKYTWKIQAQKGDIVKEFEGSFNTNNPSTL